jgi:hypothetical protein
MMIEEAAPQAVGHGGFVDFNLIMVSLVFGSIGMGMFMYGKKAGRLVPLGVGLGLMVVPYFIPNLIAMVLVCSGMLAVPWVVRES